MNTSLKTKLIYLVIGIIIGVLISMKFCKKEPIMETKIVTIETHKLDTLYYPWLVKKTVKIPVVKRDTQYLTEYKDKIVEIIDYYPQLDSACAKQLDSIQRQIKIVGTDSTIVKTNYVTQTITKTISIDPAYKRVYVGLGTLYDPNVKEFTYSYNVDFQFKNKLTIGTSIFVPFKSNKFQKEKFALSIKLPLFKFK